MPNTFITSDTHFSHENISNPYTSKWKAGYRNFKSLQEHDETIVKNINKLVTEDDTLIHLGDWSFGGLQNIWNFRKRLRCKNIHLILGNHDHHIADDKTLPNCRYDYANPELVVDGANPKRYEENGGHSQAWKDALFGVPAKALFSSVESVSTFKHAGYTIFVSHYAHRVWEGSHRGYLHFYGHSHDSICEYGKSIDVGIDSAYRYFGEYRPFKIEEAIKIADAREIAFPDHHSFETNVK